MCRNITPIFACVASLFLASATACGDNSGGDDDDDDVTIDASAIDADPNAPDADPSAPDADPTAPDADPTAPDADPGAPDAGATEGVACGTTSCMGDQICCVMQGGPGGGSQMCTAAQDCDGLTVTCDGPEDCGQDEACCGTGGGPGGGGTACQGADQCQLVVCHTAADCPGQDDVCCEVGVSGFCSPACL